MRVLSVLAAVLAVTVVAPGAWGQGAFVALDEVPELAAGAQVGRAAWPDSPCAGRERVAVLSDPTREGQPVQGLAYPERCEFVVAARLKGSDLCFVVAHELGHLARQPHDARGWGIMHPGVVPVAACWQAVAPLAMGRLSMALLTARRMTDQIAMDAIQLRFRRVLVGYTRCYGRRARSITCAVATRRGDVLTDRPWRLMLRRPAGGLLATVVFALRG